MAVVTRWSFNIKKETAILWVSVGSIIMLFSGTTNIIESFEQKRVLHEREKH